MNRSCFWSPPVDQCFTNRVHYFKVFVGSKGMYSQNYIELISTSQSRAEPLLSFVQTLNLSFRLWLAVCQSVDWQVSLNRARSLSDDWLTDCVWKLLVHSRCPADKDRTVLVKNRFTICPGKQMFTQNSKWRLDNDCPWAAEEGSLFV